MFYTVSFAQIKFTYMFCKEHSILNTNQVNHDYTCTICLLQLL